MARVPRSKAKKQSTRKKAAPARPSSRKPSKSAARPAGKAKSTAATKRGPSKAKAARPASRRGKPTRKPQTAQARAAVARKRPTPAGASGTSKAEAQAEHDHQDPRLAGIPGVSHEGDKVQAENYGAFKTKAVARMDKPTNWFRRAAKPKQ